MPTNIFDTKLTGIPEQGLNNTWYSPTMIVGLGAGYAYAGMTLHYAVVNDPSRLLTPYQVINANREYSSAFGTEAITEVSQAQNLDARKAGTANSTFTTGQRIHNVVTDSYGNVSNVTYLRIFYTI